MPVVAAQVGMDMAADLEQASETRMSDRSPQKLGAAEVSNFEKRDTRFPLRKSTAGEPRQAKQLLRLDCRSEGATSR